MEHDGHPKTINSNETIQKFIEVDVGLPDCHQNQKKKKALALPPETTRIIQLKSFEDLNLEVRIHIFFCKKKVADSQYASFGPYFSNSK
jgi:hypothetical protein